MLWYEPKAPDDPFSDNNMSVVRSSEEAYQTWLERARQLVSTELYQKQIF